MNIEMWLSGFFYLLILVLQVAMAGFGYILEPTPKHYESDAKLLSFNDNPKKFKIGLVLALIEHFCVIALAIMLFFVTNPYNLLIGIIIIIFRVGEGSIQVYIEKDYWKLLDISTKYSYTSDTEKFTVMDTYRKILQQKSKRFAFAMICWSIGTFSISIVLIFYGIAPLFIGWLGFATSILIGLSNGMKILKPKSKFYGPFSSISGLLAILFEILIGAWLLFLSVTIV